MNQIDNYFRIIESPQNDRIKQLKIHLEGGASANKLRLETSQAIIEGIHLLSAWLDSDHFSKISSVICTPESLKNPEIQDLIQKLISKVQDNDFDFPEMILIDPKLAKQVSSLGNGPTLICQIKIPSIVFKLDESVDCLIIDGVQDAGNVGTMLRTAAAAGFSRVFCTKGTANVWSTKVLRAGMGAHTHLQITEGISPKDFISSPQEIFVTSLMSESKSIYEVTDALMKPHTWVFGNEGAGVHEDFLNIGTQVYIPQDKHVESLNVASACAVCLFETRRVRHFN
jgi:TrmH family RNA methyltransferase